MSKEGEGEGGGGREGGGERTREGKWEGGWVSSAHSMSNQSGLSSVQLLYSSVFAGLCRPFQARSFNTPP